MPAHQASLVWLPHLDPATVILAAAPDAFGDAATLGAAAPMFQRAGSDGNYWILRAADGRLAGVLIGGTSVATPAAAIIPLDADFMVRAEAAQHLWRRLAGKPRGRRHDRLTPQRRRRLVLALRALDGHLSGESYRTIAQVLFGATRLPTGRAWNTHDLRDRTIRLVRTGLDLMRGGYLDLLRYPRRRRG